MTKKDLLAIKGFVEIANIFLNTACNHINSTVEVYVKKKDMGTRIGLNLVKTNIVSVMKMLDRMVESCQKMVEVVQPKKEKK